MNNKASATPDVLADGIVQELKRRPGQKAIELAQALGVERRDVNRCLSHALAGKVHQDHAYRWRLRDPGVGASDGKPESKAPPPSELERLCRYYLECIGQDSDEGVRAFASSHHGEPDYAELPSLPLMGTDWDWWNAPGAGRVLGKVRSDRGNLVAWLGYPVRLRKHRTARWEGFFVEPVMLWPIALPENAGDAYQLNDELPTPNFSFLRSLAMGDAAQLVDEAARLADDLGLNSPLEDQPEVDELLERLVAIRPDWDWREPLDPEHCSAAPSLSSINEAGIFNRAVIIPGKRSPYTQGLETELKQLAEKPEAELADASLGQWLSGNFSASNTTIGSEPLLEVLPMNSEQREAVRSALSETLTVVTGPPGTGKSQVVTNLLINAAWRGMKVLFASKNNKAVDVVEARVNGLGNRPILLRLGSKEYQAKLGSYLTAMLSGNVSRDDEVSYQEGLERHRHLASVLVRLDEIQQRTLDARNVVDRWDVEVDEYRNVFGSERFNALDATVLERGEATASTYSRAVDALDPSRQGFFGRLLAPLLRGAKLSELSRATETLTPVASHLGVPLPASGTQADLDSMRRAAIEVLQRTGAGKKVVAYQKALDFLQASPTFEDIARKRQELTEKLAGNSSSLWRDWVQMAPARLSAAQRREVADYAAVLQLMTAPDARVETAVRNRAKALQQKVTSMFSCWAVTSLAARGRIPFEPGYFDLIVIDEASQCDIASGLPLLYRAKRAVIIGDPMQLRHISAVTRQKEGELQQKYGHLETRASWMYSVNSLYDLAAGVATSANIINLRDHHRSHADIIEFSNREFYGGKLRVATRYNQLKRPRNTDPGVVWQDVKGKTIRPSAGGAENPKETTALTDALHDLIVTRSFNGTVGVVTPFRAQKRLIQEMVASRPELAAASSRCELLVDTVHQFQGDERDVMFFSPVISADMPQGALSFLRSNGNLFNVAITRARGLLHVVGDQAAAAVCGVDYLADFARYASTLASQMPHPSEQQATRFGSDYPVVTNPERVSDWERVFYRALYQAGVRPIPQFSVEQYDLDFAVIVGDRRLNIEVDGERYHRSWTGELCLRDQLRNQRMIELGWEVKRFWVYEIRDRLPQCTKQIQDWVAAAQGP